MSRKGYTLSVQDLSVSEKVKKEARAVVDEAEKKTADVTKEFEGGLMARLPGKNLEETREIKIARILNEVRTDIGKIVQENFPVDGNVNKMISAKISPRIPIFLI